MEAGLTLAVITFSAWACADPLLPADYQVKIALAAATARTLPSSKISSIRIRILDVRFPQAMILGANQ